MLPCENFTSHDFHMTNTSVQTIMHLTSSETMGWIKMAYREFSRQKLYLESHTLPPRGVVWLVMRNIEEIDAFLNKSKKFGYYPADGKNFQALCDTADQRLFIKIQNNPQHVLYKLLPDKKTYNLWFKKTRTWL